MKPVQPPPHQLWALSASYLQAGDAVHQAITAEMQPRIAAFPCIYLHGRSIELALNAVLLDRGIPGREIVGKDLGDRITALLKRIEGLAPLARFGISPEDIPLLGRCSEEYSNRWVDLPDQPGVDSLEPGRLKDLAHRVSEAARGFGKK